jgi:hypothetical protein
MRRRDATDTRKRNIPHALPLAILFAAVLSTAAPAADPPALLTGEAFQKELEGNIDIFWKDKRGLRDALAKLSETKRMAIILDRRVDPDQPIELTVSDVSLEQALRQIASRMKMGVTFFDSMVYFGPESVTYRMGTVAAIADDRAASAKKTLPAVNTDALATPRELLEAWAVASKVKLHHPELVPHDLWPALRFPAQSAASRATLLLAGFDLAIEFSPDGTHARVIPMPEQPTLTRSYAGGGNPSDRAAQITKQFPRTEVKAESGKIVVTGSAEDHDYIARLLSGKKIRRTEVGVAQKVYTLEVTNQPLGGVAKALADKVNVPVEFDDAVRDKLEQRISFSVKDATLEELFKAMLAKTGLDFEFIEGKVRIIAKK